MAQYSKTSKFYPYGKVQHSFYDLNQLPLLPKQICDYLIDAPGNGYNPPDDNQYPRCRLWKYLYYDEADPLSQPLPGIIEKMQVLYDPTRPENPPTEKGYRLIPQTFLKPSQTDAQTVVYFYVGRTMPSNDETKICVAINFLIWTHYQYETNMQTEVLSRLTGIEQALIEALHGVNFTGIGTFFFSRQKHPDCGSEEIYDKNSNVGRRLTIALEIATTEGGDMNEFDNMPFLTPDGKIRLA